MIGMIGFWAAAIPSAGALFVGIRALARGDEAERERKIRKRIRDRVDKWRAEDELRAQERSKKTGKPAGFFMDEFASVRNQREADALAKHGLERIGSYDQFRDQLTLGAAPPSRSNRTDQWILIVCAAIGIVLLVVDLNS